MTMPIGVRKGDIPFQHQLVTVELIDGIIVQPCLRKSNQELIVNGSEAPLNVVVKGLHASTERL